MFLKLALLLAVIVTVGAWMRRGAERPPAKGPSGKLSRAEAARILGIDLSSDRETVLAAHRRLIRSVHPDRGGSDFLAQQINEARDTLLTQLP